MAGSLSESGEREPTLTTEKDFLRRCLAFAVMGNAAFSITGGSVEQPLTPCRSCSCMNPSFVSMGVHVIADRKMGHNTRAADQHKALAFAT